MRAYVFAIDLSFWKNVEVLVSFFAICPFLCIGHFCARKGLGLSVPRNTGLSVLRNMGPSVPRNMGPYVPSFHGIASSFTVSNSLCLFNFFFLVIKGRSVLSIYGVAR